MNRVAAEQDFGGEERAVGRAHEQEVVRHDELLLVSKVKKSRGPALRPSFSETIYRACHSDANHGCKPRMQTTDANHGCKPPLQIGEKAMLDCFLLSSSVTTVMNRRNFLGSVAVAGL